LETILKGGDTTSTTKQVSSPKESRPDPQNGKFGVGTSSYGRDTFRLPADSDDSITTIPLLDGKDYVAFDVKWINDNRNGNRTIYSAAFVDNHGNQKVLAILPSNML
jgi:hypothetical protein